MIVRKVAVLGATGIVGQRFVRMLDRHPWFRISDLVASGASRGRPYRDAAEWIVEGEMPEPVRDLDVKTVGDPLEADLVFSALPSGVAGPAERACASRGLPVFTNASDLRMDPDVPIVVPEVNPDHLELVAPRRGQGFVVAGGNCTSVILSLALKPLQEAFGIAACQVVTFQALSGAGYPGVSGLDGFGNVIPLIPGEEPKVESEPRKILGRRHGDRIEPASFPISATCTRIPVLEGHTEAISVRTREPADEAGFVDALRSFSPARSGPALPSSPRWPLVYRPEVDRPQPRRDWSEGNGMSVVVGRVRPDSVLGWKFVAVGSNTIRGAAGGTLLAAELAASIDLI